MTNEEAAAAQVARNTDYSLADPVSVLTRMLMRAGDPEDIAIEKARKLIQSTCVDSADGSPVLGKEDLGETFLIDPDDVVARRMILADNWELIGLRPAHALMDFEKFLPKSVSQMAAAKMAQGACERVGKLPGVMFLGVTGTGKTHLMVSMLRKIVTDAWMKSSASTDIKKVTRGLLFTGVLEFLHAVRRSFDRNGADPTEIAMRAKVLVLDDLGRESTTDWAMDELMLVVQRRYEMLMPTFITSNLETAEELHDRYGDTFLSRWLDTKVYEMMVVEGPDGRWKE